MGKTTSEERFWAKVKKTETCWLWTGSKRSKGYGAFVYARNGEPVQGRAHRYSWELHNGNIPHGLCVLHKCDNAACVNPNHLWIGTKSDNNWDMVAKGRHVRGGTYTSGQYKRGLNHHAARLTPELVRAMRNEYRAGNTSYSKLSKKYGITGSAIWRVVNRRVWKHVE